MFLGVNTDDFLLRIGNSATDPLVGPYGKLLLW